MSYTPTEWKDRVVEKPRTFNMQNNPDGTVTLTPAPGTVVQEGTPVNAANLNKIEQGFVSHLADYVPFKDSMEIFKDRADMNILNLAIETEVLKGAVLTGITANNYIETFQDATDVDILQGYLIPGEGITG